MTDNRFLVLYFIFFSTVFLFTLFFSFLLLPPYYSLLLPPPPTTMSVWDILSGADSGSSSGSASSLKSQSDSHNRQSPSQSAPPPDENSTNSSLSHAYNIPFPATVDPSLLHPLANVSSGTLEYLNLDDSAPSPTATVKSALPSRGWTDDLCYGTGVTYLSGLALGGSWGFIEGVNKAPQQASPRLKLNYILNSVTRRGPFLGNSAGVVAVTYNCTYSLLAYYRGKQDIVGSIAAGGASGMIFKSTRGTKQMLISGGLVASLAAAWSVSLAISWHHSFLPPVWPMLTRLSLSHFQVVRTSVL